MEIGTYKREGEGGCESMMKRILGVPQHPFQSLAEGCVCLGAKERPFLPGSWIDYWSTAMSHLRQDFDVLHSSISLSSSVPRASLHIPQGLN
jgi:hypothetical protein